MEKFSQYSWPGNVRELENVIERLVVLGKTDVIREEDLPPEIRQMESRVASIG
jgi:DNA-binding NtrC family response regulator